MGRPGKYGTVGNPRSWGQKSHSGVQGQSPDRGFGDFEVHRKLKQFNSVYRC